MTAAGTSRRKARSRSRTDISLWDHVKLKQELLSRPDYVLRHFARCQVEALDQLQIYLEICAENPDAARRIALAAGRLGIPRKLDELLGDVLCDRPGEV
jgi:hypothetical protein